MWLCGVQEVTAGGQVLLCERSYEAVEPHLPQIWASMTGMARPHPHRAPAHCAATAVAKTTARRCITCPQCTVAAHEPRDLSHPVSFVLLQQRERALPFNGVHSYRVPRLVKGADSSEHKGGTELDEWCNHSTTKIG